MLLLVSTALTVAGLARLVCLDELHFFEQCVAVCSKTDKKPERLSGSIIANKYLCSLIIKGKQLL
jgi:hypothetical protein